MGDAFDADAVHEMVAEEFPRSAVGAAGAAGAAIGVTATEFAEVLVPIAFVAVTVKVYDVPFVSPETTHVIAVVVVHDLPPGDATTL